VKNFFLRFKNVVGGFLLCATTFSQIPGGYKQGLEKINKEDLKKFVSVLAHDSLKGRAADTNENLIAARYIAHRFYQLGLAPICGNNRKQLPAVTDEEDNVSPVVEAKEVDPDYYDSFFQKFFILDSKLSSDNLLTVTTNYAEGKKETLYDYRNDFIIDYKTPQSVSISSKVVFLGYGISDGPNNYDDYKTNSGEQLDVKNKIVLILEGYPQQDDSSSIFNLNKKGLITFSNKKKAAVAMEKGAAAVLIAKSPIIPAPPFAVSAEPLYKAFSNSSYSLPELETKKNIPLIYINQKMLKELLADLPVKIERQLSEVDSVPKSISKELTNKSIQLDIRFENKLIPSENVVGFLEGTDPVLKNEYIVVGAHFDHVGLGNYGAMNKKDKGLIHNGADDNASGSAGMMELAEAFSTCKPKRSIVFIAFNAEEMGLLGSRYYAYQNPLKDIKKTVGMVNLDMISRNDAKVIWGGGIFYSSDMKNIIEEANKEIGFEVFYNVGLLTFASDQAAFIRKKIPSVFFFAGLHGDYHTPKDKINTINLDKAERVSKLAFISSWILANTDKLPKYREMGMEEKVQLVKDSGERQKKYHLEH